MRTRERDRRGARRGRGRVVIGTAALEEPELLRETARPAIPSRIVLGLDARDGKVAVRGWREITAPDAGATCSRASATLPLAALLTPTSAATGCCGGPDVEAHRRAGAPHRDSRCSRRAASGQLDDLVRLARDARDRGSDRRQRALLGRDPARRAALARLAAC